MKAGLRFFISYGSEDKDSVELGPALLKRLERAPRGHSVFLDTVELRAGDLWKETIDRELLRCDVFLLLLGPDALASKFVRYELEHAQHRFEATRRPRIVPIRANYLGELDEEITRHQMLDWRSRRETPDLLNEIEDAVAEIEPQTPLPTDVPIVAKKKPRIPRALVVAASITIALLLASILITSRHVRALSHAQSDESVRAAYARLRTAQAWLLPRLWLIGPWSPQRIAESYWTNRGAALDADATKRLANRRSRVADEGLIVAALAAVKRGTPPLPAARAYYDAQHYAQLVATLRFAEPVQGTALAAYRTSAHIFLADGAHVFRCTPQWTCDVSTLTIDSAREAAFVDETNLITVTADGRVDQWDLGAFNTPIGRHFVLGGAGVAVAAANGNYAIAFDAKPYLSVNIDGRSVPSPPRLGRVTRVAFGPCSDCLTTLNAGGLAQIWNSTTGAITQLGDGVLDLAATRNGAVAIAWRSGVVGFYDAQPRSIGTETRLAAEEIDGMAISEDGHRVAIAHDGVVTLVDDGGSKQTLIPADKRPSPVAVAWSAGVVLTRTPEQLRVWMPSSPRSVQRDVAPGDAWREWRKQLGLTVDPSGKVVAGTAGVSQLGWNRAERRIEEQP